MDHTVVVVTHGNDPPGLAYIAPYAATSIAEYFMEAGRDVLIVYDDLTSTPRPIANFHCFCVARPVAKRFRATFSIFTRACFERSTRLARGNSAAVRSPLCRSSRQRPRTFPPIFRRT